MSPKTNYPNTRPPPTMPPVKPPKLELRCRDELAWDVFLLRYQHSSPWHPLDLAADIEEAYRVADEFLKRAAKDACIVGETTENE